VPSPRAASSTRPLRLAVVLALVATALVALAAAPAAEAQVPAGTPCQPTSSWVQGELNIIFLDVEQGDGQLVIGPTGTTMLIDLGENVWNRTVDTNAQQVAQRLRTICGVPTGPLHLDVILASHHHLDHVGYAGNPHDTTAYGNGLWELLHPDRIGFTVGTLVDRDGGTWVDSNGDGDCEVGTNASPSPDVVWHNAGTSSSTSRRWICWLYGPDGQRDRLHVQGRVLTLTNDLPAWPSFDLGPGVTAEVVQANAKGVLQADGVTPVSGDHTGAPLPPSENDYSVAVRIAYGDYAYATAGDADGEYSTSSFGYSYNDVEASMAPLFGDVDTMRVNHHGSSHSSSIGFVSTLKPETSVIQCGRNSYGHPAANVLENLRSVVTTDGSVGSDIFMSNNPCDPNVGTVPDAFNTDGDIHLVTTGGGTGYEVRYDTGTRVYVAHPAGSGGGGGGGGAGDPGGVVIDEARTRGPGGASDEFVEVRNTSAGDVDVSGWALQGCAGTSGTASNRAVVPAGTVLAAGQALLFANNGYTGAVAPDLLYSTGISDSGGVRIVDAAGVFVDGVGSSSGSTSECREGAGLSWPTSGADEAVQRQGPDTDDNAADFAVVAADPQNLASAPQGGGGSGGSGGSGGGGTTGSVLDLVINEFVADNASFPTEWVELYNPTGTDVDASGLLVDDIANGGGAPQALPAGAVVPAGGRYVFEISGFLLNNSGDDVRLLTADGATVIDAFTYTSSADDLAWFRAPDGGAWCPSMGPATRGTSNPASC
jgi:beta-lactamase superfamily II metal-dependent hydrolase